nr:HTH domain-containing protein [Thermococcus gorgonarius]
MVEVPLNPIGREEIHRLESILLFATLFRPEVIELIKDPAERLTWVDSLAVAAGAIAREKAGMTISEIAEELGRTEQTIRKHLKGETKAGQLVRETYELIKQGKLDELVKNVEILAKGGQLVAMEEYEKLKKEKEELEAKVRELEEKVKALEEENRTLKVKIDNVRKILADTLERVKEIEKLL